MINVLKRTNQYSCSHADICGKWFEASCFVQSVRVPFIVCKVKDTSRHVDKYCYFNSILDFLKKGGGGSIPVSSKVGINIKMIWKSSFIIVCIFFCVFIHFVATETEDVGFLDLVDDVMLYRSNWNKMQKYFCSITSSLIQTSFQRINTNVVFLLFKTTLWATREKNKLPLCHHVAANKITSLLLRPFSETAMEFC